MFEHVEQQHEVVFFSWLERRQIDRVDVGAVRIVCADQRGVVFDSFDFAKAAQGVEEESVAATYIEDPEIVARLEEPVDSMQQGALPRPPPPMLSIEFGILFPILLLHLYFASKREPSFVSTTYTGRAFTSSYMRAIYAPITPRNMRFTPERKVIRSVRAVKPLGDCPRRNFASTL